MDKFIHLTTIADRLIANRLCQSLEDAGIPVMLEHVDIIEHLQRASAFRLLVPTQLAQTARRLSEAASALFLHEGPDQLCYEKSA